MKKIILIFAIVLFGWQLTNAQALEQGNSLINVGMGFGSYMGSSTGYKTTFPPLYGSYEYMINDNISVGAFASYMASEYTYSFPNLGGDSSSVDDFKWKFSYLNAGALGNYHFVNNDQLDVYGGLKLGYTSVSVDNNIKTDDDDDEDFSSLFKTLKFDSSGILFGAQLGARYFFSEHIAVNVELGYGVAVASGGLTFVF